MVNIELKEKIAGEITVSDNPGSTIKKWRQEFGITKQELSREMNIAPSVISDYESGRRKSPGVKSVRRIVEAILRIDEMRGGSISRRYGTGVSSNALIDIRDYDHEMPLEKMIRAVEGANISGVSINRHVSGYTIVDGIKAILNLSSSEFSRLYGWSSQRAIFFTEVRFGRSPMVAIRVHPLKPAAVIYIQPEKLDDLAIRLSQIENIPLFSTDMDVRSIIDVLSELK